MRSMIDGQTSSADHWADTLLNIEAGKDEPSGTETRRYYRIESALATDHEMDDARGKTLKALEKVANDLIADRSHELDAIARELAAAGPIPPLAS
jgi:hypothetical protein